jgi:hypothetical protein
MMKRIETCGEPTQFYDSAGWAAIGAGIGCILTAIAFPFSANFTTTVAASGSTPASTTVNLLAVLTQVFFTVGGVAFLACGGLSLRFAKDQRRSDKRLRDVIVEDMQELKDQYIRTPISGPASPSA